MILHAGDGEEASGTGSDIWSVFVPTNFTANSKAFSGFTVVPESEAGVADPLGVACHEYGHQQGLPDIYNTATGQPTAGTWSLMDFPYGGSLPGANPPHLDIWSKLFLGFVSTTTAPGRIITSSLSGASLAPSETSSTGFYMFLLSNVSSVGANEYFLAEYRRPSDSSISFDKFAPSDGMIVWHIDDSIASNTTHLNNNDVNAPSLNGQGHMGVDLIEQNGTELSGFTGNNALKFNLGRVDRATLTGGAKAENAFRDGNTFTSPQSDAFNGQQSGLAISGITGASSAKPTLTFDLTFLQAAAGLSILKVINSPNPAGHDYSSKGSGILTTLVLQTSKPIGSRNLDIYDLLGNRVKNAGSGDIKLQLGTSGPSQDFKWVYEYDWDGTNSDGKTITSGVYLYRFKADNVVKTGKMIIIR